MKPVASILVAIITLTFCHSVPAAEPAPALSSNPGETIRGFYHWYVTELIANRDPMSNRTELKHFATARLLNEIGKMKRGPEGLNGDYFVDAQDFDNQWAKKISISNVQISGKNATAEVMLKGATADMNRKLKVNLVLESGTWKVDKVQGRD
ncbi:MAG TPA: DUF3828 domain-containing protein [Chthoniobacterales bacterium]|nr:DUF3828 domain-containing protein [Chthoniobacterales bacterium]